MGTQIAVPQVDMGLTLRRFRSRPGRDVDLVESLRRAAAERLRSGTGSALVCRTHDPQEIVWVGTQDAGPGTLGEGCAEVLESAAPTLSLRFLDGWYRLPAPPYQVWNVEVRPAGEDPLHALGRVAAFSRQARERHHIVGGSVYRAIEASSVLVGFVGLTWTWLARNRVASARMTGRADRAITWRPLSIVYQLERAPGGPTRTRVGEAAPHVPFWAGAATPPTPSTAVSEPDVATVLCNP